MPRNSSVQRLPLNRSFGLFAEKYDIATPALPLIAGKRTLHRRKKRKDLSMPILPPYNIEKHRLSLFRQTKTSGLLTAALSLFGVVIFIDNTIFGFSALEEGPPLFSAPFLLRTGLIASASMLFVRSFPQQGRQELPEKAAETCSLAETTHTETAALAGWKCRAVMLVFWLSLAFCVIFVCSPSLFSLLGRENGPVELLSAALCFLASAFYAATALTLVSIPENSGKRSFLPAALALTLFFIGMEEISWGQQIFIFQTPEIFEGNAQGETNLHNFATNLSENLYYGAAFLFLVVLPFLLGSESFSHRNSSPGAALLPGKLSIMTAWVVQACNYDMWNGFPSQVSFFVTAAILASIAADEHHKRVSITAALLATCIAIQLIWLIFGDRFVRIWDITEFKEFFIPLAFSFNAMEMLGKVRIEGKERPFGASLRKILDT
jgi:hypothetical protein